MYVQGPSGSQGSPAMPKPTFYCRTGSFEICYHTRRFALPTPTSERAFFTQTHRNNQAQEICADTLLSVLPMHENGISEISPYSLNQDYAEQWQRSLVMTAMLVSFSFNMNMHILRRKVNPTLGVFSDIPMLGHLRHTSVK